MVIDPFSLKIDKAGKLTQETIVLLDNKRNCHKVTTEYLQNDETKQTHTISELNENIKLWKEAGWHQFQLSSQALVMDGKTYHNYSGKVVNEIEVNEGEEFIQSLTVNGSTFLIQLVSTQQGIRFICGPSPGSRKRDLLPMRMRSSKLKEMIFTSNRTVLTLFDKKLIHFSSNGTQIVNQIETEYEFEFLISHSKMTSKTKFVQGFNSNC